MEILKSLNTKRVACIILLYFTVAQANATEFEITPILGQMFSSDLNDLTGGTVSVDSGTHFGIGIAWQDTPNGQGQVLINYVSHDFATTDPMQSNSLNVLYTHFNGVAQFKQAAYTTTFSLGLGGAYFDSDQSSDLYPSFTTALGTRYDFSNNFALITELRLYASLVDEEDDSFCSNDICTAQFDGAFWLDTALTVGFAYKF